MTDRAILLSLAAAIIVIVSEATQKSLPSGYWRNWYVFLPFAILINWVLYHLLQVSPSLPAAFVLFTAATWTLRPLVSLWLGHPIGVGTWIAMAFVFVAFGFRLWRP